VSAERRNLPAVIEAASAVKTSSLRSSLAVPAAIADAGDHAARRFLEFFAANIRNKNTRLAYYRAVCSFFAWVRRGLRYLRPAKAARRRLSGSQMTRRWRKTDSNPRSPVYGELGATQVRKKEPRLPRG
jgi:hypothetical protein